METGAKLLLELDSQKLISLSSHHQPSYPEALHSWHLPNPIWSFQKRTRTLGHASILLYPTPNCVMMLRVYLKDFGNVESFKRVLLNSSNKASNVLPVIHTNI